MQWLQTRQIDLEIGTLTAIASSSGARDLIDFKTCFFKRFLSDNKKILRFHVSSAAEAWRLWESIDLLLSLSREVEFADEIDIWVLGNRYVSSHPLIKYEDEAMESLMIELLNTPSSGIADAESGEVIWIHPGCWKTIGISWDAVMRCHRYLIKDLWSGVDRQRQDSMLQEHGILKDFEFCSYALDGEQVVKRLMIAQEIRIVEIGDRRLRLTKGVRVKCPSEKAIATTEGPRQA